MAQDLRELFERDRAVADKTHKLRQLHKSHFLELLEEELPVKSKTTFSWFKIAASIAILLTSAIIYFNQNAEIDAPTTDAVVNNDAVKETTISLGDLSPDLKKVENYYVANINLALSDLEVSHENEEMTNSFMAQLLNLNTAYERLNAELNAQGPNDQTITALIKNLQLRLQLLQKLKMKLNELKSSKNEAVEII